MDLSRKSKDLNRTKSQGIYDNLSGSNNQRITETEKITMAINVKASEYQKVLNNHINSVSTALQSAGITDNKIVDNAIKQAESQFRLDYNATGGKHEDFFDGKCRSQLAVVNVEIAKLNALNPTGKTGMNVEVSTICKKA